MYDIVEGSLEVKLPTIWTDEKQRWEVGRVREEKRRRKRKSQKKEDPGARKSRKVPKHCVFPMICVSGGSTSRLAKAAGAEPAGQMRDEKLHAVVARSTFRSQNVQNTPCTPLWFRRRKVHAVVARSTFPSQNVQSTPCTDHFWRFRCRKKCTPLWHEAHFQVKMYKALGVRTTFGSWDVEKVHAVVARSTFPSQNVQNTPCTDHFWRFRCRFAWQAQGIVDLVKSEQNVIFVAFSTTTTTTLHYTPIHYTTTTTTPSLHYTPLHYTALNYTQLHYTTLHYTTLHYITLHYIALHYTIFHYTTLHYTPLHYTSLHYTTLHSTTLQLHYTTFHYTPLHYTQLHYTTLNSTTFHYTTQHYTALHYTTLHHTTLEYTTLD